MKMSPKTLTILIYTTLLVLFLLFLSSHTPNHQSRHYRRLKLRPAISNISSIPHSPIPFDPLISTIQSRRDDREWEKSHFRFDGVSDTDDHAPGHEGQPEWEDFMDAEDYINDEERFNVTSRIVELFPKIDVGPSDGFVSIDELADWNLKQATKEVLHRSEREMELQDKNKDGFVSFQEFEPPSWTLSSNEDNASLNLGWWREDHFNASDVDGNGLLNLTEFNDFQHPADSMNPNVILWLCKEEVRERDTDKDGKLDFQEFFRGLFDSLRNYDEEHNGTDTSEAAPAKKLFVELDRNKDGFLSADELISVVGTLHPSEHYYAKQQAEYVLTQADADKDGKLSMKEMIEHPYVFYTSIFSEDDEDSIHDEFR